METRELAEVENAVDGVIKLAAKAIVSQETYDEAAETLKAAKMILKRIDMMYDPLIKAANEAVKKIRDEKKKYTEPVEEVEQKLRRSTSAWIAEQEEKRRAEQRKRDEEAREKEAFLADIGITETVAVEQVMKVEQAGISYRDVWKFEIVDVTLIPREYMIPNEKMIGEVARAMKSLAKIPGVRVYAEKAAIVR